MDKSYIDKVALVYLKSKKLLVSLSRGKDTWYIPGGKRDGQETDRETLIREIKEELSVASRPGRLRTFATSIPHHNHP